MATVHSQLLRDRNFELVDRTFELEMVFGLLEIIQEGLLRSCLCGNLDDAIEKDRLVFLDRATIIPKSTNTQVEFLRSLALEKEGLPFPEQLVNTTRQRFPIRGILAELDYKTISLRVQALYQERINPPELPTVPTGVGDGGFGPIR